MERISREEKEQEIQKIATFKPNIIKKKTKRSSSVNQQLHEYGT